MKKRGFTLIELLAVIVVLGLIALVVFPNVNKTIKNSKEKLYDQQVSLIEDNARRWGINHANLLPDNGVYFLALNELVTEGYISQKEIKDPRNDSTMNGCIVIRYDRDYSQYKYEYATTTCEETKLAIVYNVGDEVTFNPGDGIRTWNVIKDDGDTVTLMMNENLGDTVAWQSSGANADGPVTALETLNERTSAWTNVDAISSYEYVNNAGGSTYTYGYEKLTITNGTAVVTKQDAVTQVEISGTSRARLITGWEAATIMNDNAWAPNKYTGNIGPNWIYTTLNSDLAPNGYWTLSNRGDKANNIWYIAYTGSMHNGSNGIASDNDRNGIRPVIEIPKSKL